MAPSWRQRYSRPRTTSSDSAYSGPSNGSSSASPSNSPTSSTSPDPASEMKKFKEELARHVREKYQKLNKGSWVNATKSSTWIGSVDILKKIDDFIYVSRTSDRHNIGETISEEDAAPGGKWEQYTKEEYELRTAGVRASEFVSVSNRLRQELSATRYGDPMTLEDWSMPIPEFPPVFSSEDEDDYMDDDDGSVHCVVQSLVRDSELEGDINTSQGTSLAGENNDNMQGDSHENDALHSSSENGEADREGSELSSEDDDDHDEFISAAEEEQNERISKFFEDFPTCITKVEAVSVTSDKYSTAVMTQDPSWKCVGPARLTRRVREWLGEFALNQAFQINPAHAGPSTSSGPHSWLLASPKKEFVVNTASLQISFRSLDNEQHVQSSPMGIDSGSLPAEPLPPQGQPEQH